MKLMDRVKAAIRVRHYALSTERLYCHWIRKYIYFHDKQHPEQLGNEAVSAFLTYLAVNVNWRQEVTTSWLPKLTTLRLNVYIRHVSYEAIWTREKA